MLSLNFRLSTSSLSITTAYSAVSPRKDTKLTTIIKKAMDSVAGIHGSNLMLLIKQRSCERFKT
jgi:hypothetical protein